MNRTALWTWRVIFAVYAGFTLWIAWQLFPMIRADLLSLAGAP